MDANRDGPGQQPRRRTPPTTTGPAPRDHGLTVVRSSLLLERAATAANATCMRRDFADWLAVDTSPGDLLDDVVLAVYEALANAVEHAYAAASAPGPVRLAASRARHTLDVTVSDRGLWRDATSEPFRGRGLDVMRLLIEHVQIATTARGSVVHLRTPLPEPRPR